MKLNNNKVSLALGGLVALAHLAWSFAVMFGWAGSWLSFIFRLHFLNNPFVVSPFSWGTALMLVVVTGIVGCILGWVFSWVWNMLHK